MIRLAALRLSGEDLYADIPAAVFKWLPKIVIPLESLNLAGDIIGSRFLRLSF
jgi:hypothetical protein